MKTVYTFKIKSFTIEQDELSRYYLVDSNSNISDPVPLNVGSLPEARGEAQHIIIDFFFGQLNKIRSNIMSLSTYSPLRNRYRNFRRHLNNMIAESEMMEQKDYTELQEIMKQADELFTA